MKFKEVNCDALKGNLCRVDLSLRKFLNLAMNVIDSTQLKDINALSWSHLKDICWYFFKALLHVR